MLAKVNAVQALAEAPGQECLVVEVHARLRAARLGAHLRHARQVGARGGQRQELHKLIVGAVAQTLGNEN